MQPIPGYTGFLSFSLHTDNGWGQEHLYGDHGPKEAPVSQTNHSVLGIRRLKNSNQNYVLVGENTGHLKKELKSEDV